VIGDFTSIGVFIVIIPLVSAIIVGISSKHISENSAHRITILGIFASFVLSLIVGKAILLDGSGHVNTNIYTWASGGTLFPYKFHMGILLDSLTAFMLIVVTFISLLVHIYSIGYMRNDPGYRRFFSYISFFTFSMLLLVIANNFLQLFLGWEGVGLASYLLIGFWFKRESAIQGGLKAFLVNRVGDFGFLLGIALIFAYTGSLDYQAVFSKVGALTQNQLMLFPNLSVSIITLVCLLLFWGAMAKSAQIPLHVWLPESMEGPTPISALIHAATMVTAGIFLVTRLSPLFEFSEITLSVILIVGSTGALFLGLIAVVINDIKRVVAYSTLSQLGYMMAALGTSSYAAGIFHLGTHACFKAVLFLGAGSVILACHHEQDMRKMGGLAKYMPITYVTFVIGSLALCALPPFAGFYSKDTIIEAVNHTSIFGATYAYYCVLMGAFVTALYTFRALFMTFHGSYKGEEKDRQLLRESPFVVWFPLVVLAIPSVIMGYLLVSPMLFSKQPLLSHSIFVLPSHDVLGELSAQFHGPLAAMSHSLTSSVVWLTLGGMFLAWICYVVFPAIPNWVAGRFRWIYQVLLFKYGFDWFNEKVLIALTRAIGKVLWKQVDDKLIDGMMVDGIAEQVTKFSFKSRIIQSGYLFQYAAFMVIGTLGFMVWLLIW